MKCEFSVSKVKVLCHIVSSEGIAAVPEKIEAIRNLATPRNVAEVRSFLGMVNHVSKFADHLASKTKPLKELLKKKNIWVWGQPQDCEEKYFIAMRYMIYNYKYSKVFLKTVP